ncbi:S1 family peptidase [Candidatus Thiothrix anitrata]|uniref:Trypsin-like peptidase domain-containing protein n=1 Tax=Candidatus Thiothrix anitrata TaxID=2823902 RepID=A0ABX7X1C7_9GAMM|nr:serine protease [Candidatus Thiothrix anitrata]QTR49521.1 trypsin-like peptidase domain-containing protein [Candidatus Thiothrix anitrata]
MDLSDIIVSLWDGLPNQGTFLGSGVCIAPDKVLTAKHVICPESGEVPAKSLKVGMVRRDPGMPIKEVKHHPDRDISLLTLAQPHNKTQVGCNSGITLAQGLDVELLGYDNSPSGGDTKRFGSTLSIWAAPDSWKFHTQPSHGMSGGAVLANGTLIGIIQAKSDSQNAGIMIPLTAIWDDFLNTHLPAVTSPTASTASAPSTPSFEDQIIAQISKALSGKGMDVYQQTLREELNQVLQQMKLPTVNTQPDAIAKGLVQALQQCGRDCLVINQAFSGAMFRCFDPHDPNSVFDKVEGDLHAIQKGIETILGYLVLSLVNPDDAVQLTSWLGADDLSGYYFELHVRTLGGVELFVSHHQRRKANIDLDKSGRSINGRHIIFHSVSPFQWSDEAKLQETQLAVWNAVNHEERSTTLTSDEVEELEATLNQRRVRHRDQEHYCLVLEFEDNKDTAYTQQCAKFLSKLKIPMVRYKVPGSGKAFHGQEQNLMTAVADFLKSFNECIP